MNKNYIAKKLSVIVPAYNAEKYLKKCLESILAQTYKNLEIIVINNASTDATPAICEELKNKYSDIIFIINIEQNNGANEARKAGVHTSTGEYIAFVDADDYILENAYKKAINAMEQNSCDMVQFGAYEVTPDEKIIYELKRRDFRCNNSHDLFEYFITMRSSSYCLWDKIYNCSVFENFEKKNFEWPKLYFCDDYLLVAELFASAKNFMTISDALYCYRVHSESGSHEPFLNPVKRRDGMKSMELIVSFTEKNFPDLLPEALQYPALMNQYIITEYTFSNYKDKKEVLAQSRNFLRANYKQIQMELKKRNRKLKWGYNEKHAAKTQFRTWFFAFFPTLAVIMLKTRLKIHKLAGI